jgi:Transposase IS4
MTETNIKFIKWVDNAVVSVASTLFGKLPVGSVSRYSRVQRSRISVPCPAAIKEYNKNMGGTDRMDQNINAYRIGVRGKKWWCSIFTWLVDVSVQNAWILHRAGGSAMPQLDFRLQIAARYCSSLGESIVAKNYRRPKTAMKKSDAPRGRVETFLIST